MYSSKNVLCAATALIAVAGAYYLFASRGGGDLAKEHVAPEGARAEEQDTTGPPKQDAFRRALASSLLERTQDAHREIPEVVPEDDTEPGYHQPTPTELARDAIRNEVIRQFSFEEVPRLLDTMVAEQPRDPTRTKEVKDELELAIERIGDELSELKEVSCHGALCRIVVTHGSSAEARQFWLEASDNGVLGGPRQRFTNVLEGEQVETTCYMGRPGQDEELHRALLDRMYKELTSEEVSEIQPTRTQIAEAVAKREAQAMAARNPE